MRLGGIFLFKNSFIIYLIQFFFSKVRQYSPQHLLTLYKSTSKTVLGVLLSLMRRIYQKPFTGFGVDWVTRISLTLSWKTLATGVGLGSLSLLTDLLFQKGGVSIFYRIYFWDCALEFNNLTPPIHTFFICTDKE